MRSFDAELQAAHNVQTRMNELWRGKRVRLNAGKYAGRVAVIDGVHMNLAWRGPRWEYVCYVLRANGKGRLNTDGASRAYHPREHFDVLEDQPND